MSRCAIDAVKTLVLSGATFAILSTALHADAALSLRQKLDVRGDATAIGSTLAWDCGAGITPPPGSTATCTGALESDTAPDQYWLDNVAANTVFPTDARTSAQLTLPNGATVKYARLYWSALKDQVIPPLGPDTTVTLDRPGGFSSPVIADATTFNTALGPGSPTVSYIVYQSSADVTSTVVTNGSGIYRLTGVEAVVLNGVSTETAYAAWTLVVVYEIAGAEYRQVTLYDGLDLVDDTRSSSLTFDGFRIPATGTPRGSLTVWGYDGDDTITGDRLRFKGTSLLDAAGSANNFFNGSRSLFGAPVVGVVPALSGQPRTMAGYDLDAVDVSTLLSGGDTSATMLVPETSDSLWLGGALFSVASSAPNLVATKSVVDLNGGVVKPGDVLEFTIAVTNTGDDEATNVVLTDPLPLGLTYLPNSLRLVTEAASSTDAAVGAKTDPPADDVAEFDAATRIVRFRLGKGATSLLGGALPVSESTSVAFRVTVTGAPGSVVNQATIVATGKLGAPPTTFLTDGDPTTIGQQGTTVPVKECDASGGCIATSTCDLSTNMCVSTLDGGVDAGISDAFAADSSNADALGGDGSLADAGTTDTSAAADGAASDGGAALDARGDGATADSAAADGAAGDGAATDGTAGDGTAGDGADSAIGDGAGDGTVLADGGEDTSVPSDAAIDGAVDGALVEDALTDGGDAANPLDDAVAEGGGCACRVSTAPASDARLGLAAGLAVIALLRRRSVTSSKRRS